MFQMERLFFSSSTEQQTKNCSPVKPCVKIANLQFAFSKLDLLLIFGSLFFWSKTFFCSCFAHNRQNTRNGHVPGAVQSSVPTAIYKSHITARPSQRSLRPERWGPTAAAAATAAAT